MKMLKTKVVVSKNGGTLAKAEKWTYGGENLEVVPYFTCRIEFYKTIVTGRNG